MSRVEVESFIKSFLLFSSSLGLLIGTLFYLNFTKEVKTLDDVLFSQMRLCSYDLKCDEFTIDFVSLKTQVNYTLYKEDGLSAYFPIPGANEFVMQIHLTQESYAKRIEKLKDEGLFEFMGTLFVVFILTTP